MKEGEIVLLENVRFHAEEEQNDPEFAKQLASLAELYVSDAFGTVHRAHASTAGVAAYLPAVAGFLIGKELGIMGKALEDPERPFVAILGGAKVSDKIGVITNLLDKCDSLIIGGGMAYTFLKAKGLEIGTSLLDADSLELAKDIMAKAKAKGVNFLLPVDNVVATEYKADADHKIVASEEMPAGWMGLDIGPKTIEIFKKVIVEAKTVIWNGPMACLKCPRLRKGPAPLRKPARSARARPSSAAATPPPRSEAWLCQADDAYLHGRRRVP